MEKDKMREDAEALRQNLSVICQALRVAAETTRERAKELRRMSTWLTGNTFITSAAAAAMAEDAEYQADAYERTMHTLELLR